MFDWLFPNWSDPVAITVLLGARFLVNVSLTAVVVDAVGLRTLYTGVVGATTLLSAALAMLLVRPGGLGLGMSYVELSLQVALVVVAGHAVYSSPSGTRRAVAAAALVAALALGLVMVPVYGERFVAP